MSLACRGCSGEGNFPLLGLKSWKGTCERVVTQCDTRNVPQLYILHGFQAEPAPGHLHQGGILISRGGTNHVVCVCVWGGGWVKWEACHPWSRAVGDARESVQLLLCVLFYRFSLPLLKSIMFSKEGREWKVGGIVTRLGGHGPRMPPLGAGPGFKY